MPSPIAHSLMGTTLYRDGSSFRGRQWTTLALFVFLANAPDLDFLPGVITGHPFAFHRLITHSLTFVAISTLAVYAALRLLRRPHAGRIARAVVLGLLSHIALDYFCGAPNEGVAILWPFSAERVYSSFRVFPSLFFHPMFGRSNLEVAIIEVSVMMILMQISTLHRLWSVTSRKTAERRLAEKAKGVGLNPAAE